MYLSNTHCSRGKILIARTITLTLLAQKLYFSFLTFDQEWLALISLYFIHLLFSVLGVIGKESILFLYLPFSFLFPGCSPGGPRRLTCFIYLLYQAKQSKWVRLLSSGRGLEQGFYLRWVEPVNKLLEISFGFSNLRSQVDIWSQCAEANSVRNKCQRQMWLDLPVLRWDEGRHKGRISQVRNTPKNASWFENENSWKVVSCFIIYWLIYILSVPKRRQ